MATNTSTIKTNTTLNNNPNQSNQEASYVNPYAYSGGQLGNQAHTSNLIDEFFFIYDEDNKLIDLLKDEFSDLKFFNYGSIVYFQMETEGDQGGFPHVSELLENYEKIYSKTCYKGNLIMRLTKCKKNF
jgi:hypothetical protein